MYVCEREIDREREIERGGEKARETGSKTILTKSTVFTEEGSHSTRI